MPRQVPPPRAVFKPLEESTGPKGSFSFHLQVRFQASLCNRKDQECAVCGQNESLNPTCRPRARRGPGHQVMGTSPQGAPHVPAHCKAEFPRLQPGWETSRAAPGWVGGWVIAGKIWDPPTRAGRT